MRMLSSLCFVIQRCQHGTPLGFCLRVNVNENPLNLEKTTYLVFYLYFLLIYGFKQYLTED